MQNSLKATIIFVCVALVGATFGLSSLAWADRFDDLANSPMAKDRPTAKTAKLLKD